MICHSFSYTPERAEQVSFTPPYYEAGEGMVVLKTDMTPYQSWAEVRDQPVGTIRGSSYHAAMERSGIFTNLRPYDNGPQGLAAVAAGEIKAFFNLRPILAYLLRNGYPELQLVEGYQPSVVGTFNIAVRKDDPELLAAVNASLAKLAADGAIRRILAKWCV